MKTIITIIISCSIIWLVVVSCLATYGLFHFVEDYQYNKGQIACKEMWSGIVKGRTFDVEKDNFAIKDGTTLEVPEIFALACCDCGLSHLHRFYEKNGKHYISFWRNVPITKLMRETRDYPCRLENQFNLKMSQTTR